MTDFKAKMHQIRSPDPVGGAYSAPPGHLAGFGGLTSKGRGKGREGGKGGEGKGGEGREKGHEPPPQYLEEVYACGFLPMKNYLKARSL